MPGFRGQNRAAGGFEVRGAEDFLALSKALKAAGRTELRKKLHKGLRTGAKPLLPKARQAAKDTFPTENKLNAREAKTRFRIQVRTGKEPGVRVVADGRYVNVKLSNERGFIRHPVFADPSKTRKDWAWVNQKLPDSEHWYDRAMVDNVHEVLPALERVIQQVVNEITREARRG